MSQGGHGGGGGAERYLVTYADLITLLLAFFIIMYASSKADLDKFAAYAGSFQQVFGASVLSGGGPGVLSQNTGIFDFQQLSPVQQQFMHISEKLEGFASSSGMGESIGVNVRDEGIAVTLSNALLFPSGGTELGPDSKQALHEIAELIRPLPNEIRVEAHTDNLPTNSPLYPTNWELSAARASAVVRYLVEHEAIEPGRLSALGYAEFRPLYANETREERLLNRRADIVVLYPSAKLAPAVDLMQTESGSLENAK